MTENVKKINTVLVARRVDCAGRNFSVGHYSCALAAYRVLNLYADFTPRSKQYSRLYATSVGLYLVSAMAGHHTGIFVGSSHFIIGNSVYYFTVHS